MPVFINEVLTEVIPVPESESNPMEERTPVDESDFDLVQKLALIEERRLRLAID